MANRVTLTLEDIGAEEHRGRHPEPLDRNAYEQNHYLATLHYDGRTARYRFTTGSAWERPPVAREVLESVLSDSSLLDAAETLEEARDALHNNLGDDENVDELARVLLAADKKTRRLLGHDYDAATSDPNGWAWEHTDEPPAWISRSQRPRAGMNYAGAIGRTRQGEPVRVEIELRQLEPNEARGIPAGALELSITGSTPYSGGQILETLAELETYADPWTAETVAELADIWRRWHMNGMNSACVHQRAAGWTYDEHRGSNPDQPYEGDACPECGYRIGSAWLYEPLPADILEWLAEHVGIRPPAVAAV